MMKCLATSSIVPDKILDNEFHVYGSPQKKIARDHQKDSDPQINDNQRAESGQRN